MGDSEQNQWIVSFGEHLGDDAWAALEDAGLSRTDGPPTGAPAVLVEARSPAHAEARVQEVLLWVETGASENP